MKHIIFKNHRTHEYDEKTISEFVQYGLPCRGWQDPEITSVRDAFSGLCQVLVNKNLLTVEEIKSFIYAFSSEEKMVDRVK